MNEELAYAVVGVGEEAELSATCACDCPAHADVTISADVDADQIADARFYLAAMNGFFSGFPQGTPGNTGCNE